MVKTYTLKNLWSLLPFKSEEGPLLATLDLYGDGLVKYAVTQDGIWLVSQSKSFSTHEYESLTGAHPTDRVLKQIDGAEGYFYGMQGGLPLLPFPFTARQFKEFDERAGGIFSSVMDKGGYPALSDDEIKSELEKGPPPEDSEVWSPEGRDFNEEWLTELKKANPDAEELARAILSGIELEDDLVADAIDEASNSSGAPANTGLFIKEKVNATVDAGKPWWQTEYSIMEMAKNKGASIQASGRNPSNAQIAKEIAKHIANSERSKGSDRKPPNHDTIRGLLTGWSWKPE